MTRRAGAAPGTAGVLACEFAGRLAPCRFGRRDAAQTRRRGRLRYLLRRAERDWKKRSESADVPSLRLPPFLPSARKAEIIKAPSTGGFAKLCRISDKVLQRSGPGFPTRLSPNPAARGKKVRACQRPSVRLPSTLVPCRAVGALGFSSRRLFTGGASPPFPLRPAAGLSHLRGVPKS